MDMSSFAYFSLLYVEDDTGVREVNLRFLKRMFHTVYFATNGEEGLKSYEEHKPDIIITDLKMPIMDGLSMVKRLEQEITKLKSLSPPLLQKRITL